MCKWDSVIIYSLSALRNFNFYSGDSQILMSWQIRYVRELKFVEHTVLLLWPLPRQPPHPFAVFCSYQTFPTWTITLKKRSSDLVFFTSLINEIIMVKGRFDWFQLSLEPLWCDQDNVHKNQTHVNNLTMAHTCTCAQYIPVHLYIPWYLNIWRSLFVLLQIKTLANFQTPWVEWRSNSFAFNQISYTTKPKKKIFFLLN